MLELVTKFQKTRTVVNKNRNTENSLRNEAGEIKILGHLDLNPTLSISSLVALFGIKQQIINEF